LRPFIKTSLSALALAAGLFVAPSSSQAGSRLYNASGCQLDDVHNASCLIERSNTTNTNGLAGLWVRLFVTPGDDINCVVTSTGLDGSDALNLVRRRTAAGASGVVKLDWGTSINRSVSQGTFLLHCSGLVSSSIIAYKVTEF
jgi:hypothetical protein